MNDQPKPGMGCFASGCAAALVVGSVLFVLTATGVWYLYRKAVDNYTSAQRMEIRIEPLPSDDEYRAAQANLDRLREAVRTNQEATVAFSATDLNALVARQPEFSRQHGKVRFEIADSVMTVDLSTSLDSSALPALKGRWFNGRARFSFSYTLDQFVFNLKSAEAGGRDIPRVILSQSFTSSFNSGFNRSFRRAMERDSATNTFWEHIKTISLQGDKMVLTTQAR